jgi:hypothetical protein
MSDFSQLSQGINFAGNVMKEEEAFIGPGAVIILVKK